jgi:hypothetical protein
VGSPNCCCENPPNLPVNDHNDSAVTTHLDPSDLDPSTGEALWDDEPASSNGRPAHRRPRRRRWRRRVLFSLLGVLGLLVLGTAGTAAAAALTPGNESFSAKWADWVRAHGGATLTADLENWYYSNHQPKAGGRLARLNPIHIGGIGPTPSTTTPHAVSPPKPFFLPAPPPIAPVTTDALPGEGVWQPIGPTIDGAPSMYEAQFRADDIYTSQITTAVWVDPYRLHVSLIPGATEPGGTWPHPPYVTSSERPGLVAAFNGGFRLQDAHGGFYLDGRTGVPLVDGAASLVIYSNGRIDVGAWGSEVQMTPNVVAVLQNLVPMVDNGQVSPSATYDDASVWGTTIKTSIVVPRSGVGVTSDGALVYVAGPALSARTLAESLQRAGAVRAMTLDINPTWVTFNLFSHPEPSNPAYVVGSKLYPQMQRSADRYLTWESRDFFEISDS